MTALKRRSLRRKRSRWTAAGLCRDRLILRAGQLLFQIDDLFNLREKPAIDFREVENLVDAEAGAQSVANKKNAFGVGNAQFACNQIARKNVTISIKLGSNAPRFAVPTEAAATNLQ